jgi:hypothetical protein
MIPRRIVLEGASHCYVDDLVRDVRIRFGGRGGNGFHPAIVLTQSRAFSLSAIPGKCRRNSTMADSSPLSSNAWRMAAAIVSSTLNMGHTMTGRITSDNRKSPGREPEPCRGLCAPGAHHRDGETGSGCRGGIGRVLPQRTLPAPNA